MAEKRDEIGSGDNLFEIFVGREFLSQSPGSKITDEKLKEKMRTAEKRDETGWDFLSQSPGTKRRGEELK